MLAKIKRLCLSAQYGAIWRRAIFGKWDIGGGYQTDSPRLANASPSVKFLDFSEMGLVLG